MSETNGKFYLGRTTEEDQPILYDPDDLSEYRKALILAYLGSLKFANLDELACAPLPKALAFCAAAYLLSQESL